MTERPPAPDPVPAPSSSRRDFLRTTSLGAAASVLGSPLVAATVSAERGAFAAGSDEVRIGVVGCGGRGTGAAHDAISSSEGVRLVALGDLDLEICRNSRSGLEQAGVGDHLDVPESRMFAGLDAYRRVIEHPDVDIALLTTPPGFRPMHLDAAVRAGKHVFAEKPVCVDPTGYRSCLASGEIAAAKGTAIVTGTQFRRQPSYMEAIERIHDGAIGRPVGGVSYYCVTGIWYRPRRPGESEVAYQCRNWYHFTWLSGDQIVEQAVHSLDAVNWAMGGPPVRAFGSGGQMTRPEDSEIYDHMSIDFEYPNGAVVSFKCRQLPGSSSKVINTIHGTEGVAYVNPGDSRITDHDGTEMFVHEGRGNNPYVREHADLIASIRAGTPIVEIRDVADSSLTAVMGRLAAYSGREVSWDWTAHDSTLDLMPEDLRLSGTLPSRGVVVPGTGDLV